MSEGLSRKVPVMFDDVAVCFSEEEWEILAEWQRELYKEVMKENLETVLSLGFQIPRPDVISLMERGGEDCVEYPKDSAPKTHFEGNGFLGPDEKADAINRAAEQPQQPREAPSLPNCDARVQWGRSSCSEFGPQAKPGCQLGKAPEFLGCWGTGSGAIHNGHEDTSGLPPNHQQSQAEKQQHRRPRGKGSVAAQHLPRAEWEVRPLQCPPCVKSFTPRPRLTEHLRTHSGDRPCKCLDCGKTFGKHLVFVVHRRNHTGEHPFPCPACEKRFSHCSHLMVHQRIHGDECSYPCADCHKSFISKSRLTVHRRTHTGEQPYACAECQKSFIKRCNLQVHQRTHTREKPYCCIECDRTFIQHSNLVLHLRTHSGERPYHCAQCQKGFICHTQLMVHQRIHTGERPYRCLKCGKGFHQLTNLTTHQRTHLAERALPCSQPARALLSPREST
ncbi:uncharacterized protein LOC142046281 [Chelonoidis abingdonii]|uniref:uncharacterized protein LOC142046281 n=1 Tax=Chelonoidis abingdonii TaxID=106734 RepID=UPI003F499722